jgi:penicillin V acylase-like amidase (Ntn superfamily)
MHKNRQFYKFRRVLNIMTKTIGIAISILFCILFVVLPVSGCSEFILKNSSPDKTISGRTIDFLYSTLTDTNFAMEARGQSHSSLSSILPTEPGLSWNNT